MKTEDVSELIAQLGELMGFYSLCLNGAQACTFDMGDMPLTLQWKEESSTLILYTPVGSMSHRADRTALYRQLLEANCLGAETGGFTLGILDGMEIVILSGQIFPMQHMTITQLADFVTLFIEEAETWKKIFLEDVSVAMKTGFSDIAEPKQADCGNDLF